MSPSQQFFFFEGIPKTHSDWLCWVAGSVRGEGEIEKVFVLDAHGFIRQKEVFVERSLLRSWSLETGF